MELSKRSVLAGLNHPSAMFIPRSQKPPADTGLKRRDPTLGFRAMCSTEDEQGLFADLSSMPKKGECVLEVGGAPQGGRDMPHSDVV